MTGPFENAAGTITLRLGADERGVLHGVPLLLEAGGDSTGRLDYRAHPDDAAAEAKYRSLVSGQLDDLRATDRKAFARVLDGGPVSPEDVEAFMRVVGEARIVLAARLGIEVDGWEAEIDETNPEMAWLSWLGYLQDSAVVVLSEFL